VNASDPALKECLQAADLGRCRESIEAIPLRRFSYITAYEETYKPQDHMRLGVLTTEVARQFPKSVSLARGLKDPLEPQGSLGPLPLSHETLDLTQTKFAHLGLTQYLLKEVRALEVLLAQLLERKTTQRKAVL
jgi:hypothetical protein